MKLIKVLLTAVIICLSIGANAQAHKLNEKEKSVQKSLIEYLRTQGITTSIDSNDNSVCFKRNGILYWITIKDNTNGVILYTLYRNGIKYANTDNPAHNYRNDIAVLAANRLNTEQTFKTFQVPGAVKFCIPYYAESADDFKAAFPAMMSAFENVKDKFDAAYKKSKLQADSIHNYWQELDTLNVIIPQQGIANTAPTRNLTIENIAVRNVDANDNVISGYDQGIRRARCQFIQPRVTLRGENKGIYKVAVRIYTPDNKLLLPADGARYTTISTINVKKGKKESDTFDLLKFGSKDSDVWKAGEYRIEFYEDDNLIYTDAINIL